MEKSTTIKIAYVWIPALIGLGVISWMFSREFNAELFSQVRFSGKIIFGILLAFLFMIGRDIGLMWRFRLFSGNFLTWRQAFHINILCEFTSAVTPSAVGGGSLIPFFLNKEGINAGKSTAITLSCLFLDELFLVVACPLILMLIPFDDLFGTKTIITTGTKILFVAIYVLTVLWTLILYLALFRHSELVRALFLKLFRLRLLRRWYPNIVSLTDNLVTSSHEMSDRPFSFWAKAFGVTTLSWCSRYLVVNALLLAFALSGNHLLAFARQLILWIILMISPTPGGSGISEYMFTVYYADFFSIVGVALIVAFVWRCITYYPYLVAGIFILPQWIKRTR